jgi:hypothetical protein
MGNSKDLAPLVKVSSQNRGISAGTNGCGQPAEGAAESAGSATWRLGLAGAGTDPVPGRRPARLADRTSWWTARLLNESGAGL